MRTNISKVDYTLYFYDGIARKKYADEVDFNHLIVTNKNIRDLESLRTIKCRKTSDINYLEKENKSNFLYDSYIGKKININGEKISKDTYESFIAENDINLIISSFYNDYTYEDLILIREYIRRNFDKLIGNNHDEHIYPLKKDINTYEQFLSFIEKDGIWNYYNIFLDKDTLINLLTTCSLKRVKYIYNVCVFAYNSLMNEKEKKVWEDLINDENVAKLFYFAGGVYSNHDDKDFNYLTNIEENEIINELLKHKMYDLTCYSEVYDITESDYIKYILRNRNILYKLFEYDPAQYSIIIKKLNDLKYILSDKTIEELKSSILYFEHAFNSPALYQNDEKYEYKNGASKYGSKENIIKTIKKYAPNIYDNYSKENSLDSMLIFSNVKEIAVKLKNVQGIKYEHRLSKFCPKKIYETDEDEQYIFLTNLGDGIFQEETTGMKLILSNKLIEYKLNDESLEIIKKYPLCILSDSSVSLSSEEEFEYLKNNECLSEYFIRNILSNRYELSMININKINSNPIENNIMSIITKQMKNNTDLENEEKKSEESVPTLVAEGYYVRKK